MGDQAGRQQPYAISRQDGSPVVFAGVWEWWKAPDRSLLRTFAILTTSANTTMRQLHERMPVIVEPDDWTVWLENAAQAIELMRPAGDNALHLWPVFQAIDSVKQRAELLNPADEPHAQSSSDAPA